MGFRLGSFTCIYRRLHDTIRPRKGIIASPKVLNLEGTFILSGALHPDTSRRSHMGHAHHHHRDHEDGGTAGERVTKLGLAADITLAGGKAFAGYLSGSTAIIADAAHSVSDVICGFKIIDPNDRESAYVHLGITSRERGIALNIGTSGLHNLPLEVLHPLCPPSLRCHGTAHRQHHRPYLMSM